MTRSGAVRSAAAALLAVGLLASCATTGTRSFGHGLHRVPTSSWRPGDPSLDALAIGTLTAGLDRHRWCLWLTGPGSRRNPVVWPAGFRARRHPVELLDSRGRVVARGGERIKLGGGGGPAGHETCMLGRKYAFFAMSYPSRA
jgi:hypothetical protein